MATAQQEIKNLKKDMKQIKDMLTAQARDVAPNGADTSRIDVDAIKDRAREAGEKAREYLRNKQDQAVVARDKAEQTIKDRPFTTTAAAFASGAIVAALLSRR
ncbi:hypothetical protein [Kordiimonas aestuarii]|uniref:hypothetical protein n=1 Tax=Kordiimonas aestuarii TaxID=1005925 RepID=UPI0021D19A64|nr:hypothetical protein [Kordiimonas aestuarii]